MRTYGQYCPIAKAAEALGDRWTLLIVREMLHGTEHFNDFERNLPGISRSVLAQRLRQLEWIGLAAGLNQTGARIVASMRTGADSRPDDADRGVPGGGERRTADAGTRSGRCPGGCCG
jgi:hypothetical protein